MGRSFSNKKFSNCISFSVLRLILKKVYFPWSSVTFESCDQTRNFPSFYGRVELRVSSEIMSLKIVKNTGVTWIENTRAGHWNYHGPLFNRIFEIEEIPSLKLNAKLCFSQDYDSDPIFEIKVIEGFEKLKDFKYFMNVILTILPLSILSKVKQAVSLVIWGHFSKK